MILRRLTLFHRLPRWRWVYQPRPLIRTKSVRERFPQFQREFESLERTLEPAYHRAFAEAGRLQNRMRLTGCLQIVGTTLLSGCAAGNIALRNVGLEIGVVILGMVVGGLNQVNARSADTENYLRARQTAEVLRWEAFAFLGKRGPYAEPADREQALRQRVNEIIREERHG